MSGIVRKGDPRAIREFVQMADREGFTPQTISTDRIALVRYICWLRAQQRPSIDNAGLADLAAYRAYLLTRAVSRLTVQDYLRRISSYYYVRMRRTGDVAHIELCEKLYALCHSHGGHPPRREHHDALTPDTVRRMLVAARRRKKLVTCAHTIDCEDYVFLLVLLYTGARASIYGLRVDEIHFREHEIRTRVKGGGLQVIPLHPKLETALKRHLASRKYGSSYVFRWGRDQRTYHGSENNRMNAELICRRTRTAAGLTERVSPHRFRATVASVLRSHGMKLEFVQAILGHRDPTTTLRSYVNVDWDVLKRDFAAIDLDPRPMVSYDERAMQRLAPRGTQHAWNLVVRGLLGLTESRGSLPTAPSSSALQPGRAEGEGP